MASVQEPQKIISDKVLSLSVSELFFNFGGMRFGE